MNREKYEVRWCIEGWTFVAARVYDKTKLTNKFKRFLSEWFGYARLHQVTCIESNGFRERYFDTEIKMMAKTEYTTEIEAPAIAHYEKFLAARKTWE